MGQTLQGFLREAQALSQQGLGVRIQFQYGAIIL